MNRLFRCLTEVPRRWFRSRGFGVHSPFAFAFINDVLRIRRYALYCYPEIRGIAPCGHGGKRALSMLRLWARLVSRFNPERVSAVGLMAREAMAVAGMVSPKSVESSENATLLWIGEEQTDVAALARTLEENEAVALFYGCRATADALRDVLGQGMCFHTPNGTMVAVAHTHLPRQDFKIDF